MSYLVVGEYAVGATGRCATAAPYQSANPDATNIYVTATLGQAWTWALVG